MAPNFARFWPSIFFYVGEALPNLSTWIIKLSKRPTAWQSFRARRSRAEEKEASAVKHKTAGIRTTVPDGL